MSSYTKVVSIPIFDLNASEFGDLYVRGRRLWTVYLDDAPSRRRFANIDSRKPSVSRLRRFSTLEEAIFDLFEWKREISSRLVWEKNINIPQELIEKYQCDLRDVSRKIPMIDLDSAKSLINGLESKSAVESFVTEVKSSHDLDVDQPFEEISNRENLGSSLESGELSAKSVDRNGNTLLHVCGPDMVSELVKKGADLNAANRYGTTPLMSSFKSPEKAKKLVELGADLYAKNREGMEALGLVHFVHSTGRARKMLSPKEADACLEVREIIAEAMIDQANDDLACGKEVYRSGFFQWFLDRRLLRESGDKKAERLQKLIGAGASVTFKGTKGRTPLMVAIEKGRFENAELLIEAGSDLGEESEILLSMAMESSNPEKWVGLLLKSGLHPDTKFRNGSIVAYAIENGVKYQGLVREALMIGANPDSPDAYGCPPLILAARKGRIDHVTSLIDHDVSLDSHSDKGDNALFSCIASNDKPEILEMLIGAGMDPESKSGRGFTMREEARKRGRKKTLKFLDCVDLRLMVSKSARYNDPDFSRDDSLSL